MNAKITGTGRYLPEYVLNNEELSRMVDTSDEWIVTHTGMRERRIAQGEKCWEMGVAAAQKALHDAGVAPEQVDMIIGCSSTPDYLFPQSAASSRESWGRKMRFVSIRWLHAARLSLRCKLRVNILRTALSKPSLIVAQSSSPR